MDQTLRDRLSILIVALAALAGLVTIASRPTDLGIAIGRGPDGHLIVADIDPMSDAWRNGIRPGDIVVDLDGAVLLRLPQYVYASVEPVPDPLTGEYLDPKPIGIDPLEPEFVDYPPEVWEELLSIRPTSISVVEPTALDKGNVDVGWPVNGASDSSGWQIDERGTLWWLGTGLYVGLAWWLLTGRAGHGVSALALPFATAVATPFLVAPLWPVWQAPYPLVAGLIATAAMVPLAGGLIERIDDARDRRFVVRVTTGAVLVATVASVLGAYVDPYEPANMLRFIAIPTIPFFPGVAAARPKIVRAAGAGTSTGPILAAAEYAVLGATPLIALLSAQPSAYVLLGLWFLLVLAAGRFTVRPLVRLASRAALQRDLVVAATEAERARVAADIHDDALQELTLLIHRLDQTGDTESADIARAVSDRLRAICGDLRLPILDDLGVGPALDWLVLRIERLAGGEVRLERSDGTRPPPDVELAFFRVAQEALSNAVRHGRPPILVRYATTPGGASLTIDDAGDGILPDAGETAERTGHFGLLNMQQRAEAIGAILDIRRWPAGGTHVKLDWRAS